MFVWVSKEQFSTCHKKVRLPKLQEVLKEKQTKLSFWQWQNGSKLPILKPLSYLLPINPLRILKQNIPKFLFRRKKVLTLISTFVLIFVFLFFKKTSFKSNILCIDKLLICCSRPTTGTLGKEDNFWPWNNNHWLDDYLPASCSWRKMMASIKQLTKWNW